MLIMVTGTINLNYLIKKTQYCIHLPNLIWLTHLYCCMLLHIVYAIHPKMFLLEYNNLFIFRKLYEIVKNMYIEAAQRSLETGFVDADVQNGLGVLLNLNSENDKAVDCFKAALQVRPKVSKIIFNFLLCPL